MPRGAETTQMGLYRLAFGGHFVCRVRQYVFNISVLKQTFNSDRQNVHEGL